MRGKNNHLLFYVAHLCRPNELSWLGIKPIFSTYISEAEIFFDPAKKSWSRSLKINLKKVFFLFEIVAVVVLLAVEFLLNVDLPSQRDLSNSFFNISKNHGSQSPPLFRLFSVFSNKDYNFYNKSMWINVMSLQYITPGFEPTTSQTLVISNNH